MSYIGLKSSLFCSPSSLSYSINRFYWSGIYFFGSYYIGSIYISLYNLKNTFSIMFTEELLPFIIWPRAGQLFMVHFLCFMTLWPKFKNPFDLKLIITLINFFKFFIIVFIFKLFKKLNLPFWKFHYFS